MSLLTYATAQLLRVLPRQEIGRALGRLAERPWSLPIGRAVVGLYSKLYDVRLDDCAHTGDWASFDAFFTRALRDGTRPLDADPRALVSPADGRIESMARIDEESTLLVKGRPYRVHELVGSQEEAARYKGGWGCVVYLSPRDYHRVHSPVRGKIREIVSLPGDYYPVNAVGLAHVPNLFARNRRVSIAIDTEGQGRVTLVMVAAMIVGRITVNGLRGSGDVPFGRHTLEPAVVVERGGEIGAFHLGSTVVMLAERRAIGRWLAQEGPVRLGVGIAGDGTHAVLSGETNGRASALEEVG
jgi:phosphatidylserine decarboxylase